jgi:hypothetical protein
MRYNGDTNPDARDTDEPGVACPCCGKSTGGGYCAACDAAECGERDASDPSINVCLVQRAKDEARLAHAAKVSREAVARLCRGGGA